MMQSKKDDADETFLSFFVFRKFVLSNPFGAWDRPRNFILAHIIILEAKAELFCFEQSFTRVH